MATRWYRAYVGTATDPKIQAIAFTAKTHKCKVIAMWHFILELAADAQTGGKVKMDTNLFCGVLDLAPEEVKSIWACMIEREMVTDDEVISWKKRQYETDAIDPTNAERQRRWKQKHLGNGQVTVIKRPDTDTDTDKYIEGNPGRKKPAIRIPDDWVPKSNSVEKAARLGFSAAEIGRESQKFKNHAREKDRRAVRWDAAFDNWIINAAGYQNKSPPITAGSNGFQALPGTPEFSAWKSYASDSGKSALVRILNQREMEGRAFSFETQWPPNHRTEAA